MADRVLRGSRLGGVSYESDRNTDLAPRQATEYACTNGHVFSVPFAADAEVPQTWSCRSCGAASGLVGGEAPEPKKAKPARTHMDMLRERRSPDDLEAVLQEALEARGRSKKKSA